MNSDTRREIERVIAELRGSRSCAAAIYESQTCSSTITARWAARELRRVLERDYMRDPRPENSPEARLAEALTAVLREIEEAP